MLARNAWCEEIRKNGLKIKSIFSPWIKAGRVPVVAELKPEDCYDVVFVIVRYTHIESVIDTLRACCVKNIVFVGNNVRAEEIAALLPEKNVLFAFSLSAGHRETDRAVSMDLKKITIGQLREAPSNEALINEVFSGTEIKVVYEPNMGDYLLCHAAFMLPTAFACYKTDGNLRKLKGNIAYFNRLIDANIETYRAIRNAGHEILPEADKLIKQHGIYRRFITTRSLAIGWNVKAYRRYIKSSTRCRVLLFIIAPYPPGLFPSG